MKVEIKTITDYARSDYYYTSHHNRFKQFINSMKHKLPCQDCGGSGGETIPILDDGTGPFEDCGWCESTGYVTPWVRGLWLRLKKSGEI